jgi:hypothetical protein
MQQQVGQASMKNKLGPAKLAPAFEVAGRYCARKAQENPAASVIKIGTAQGLAFEDNGSRVPLGLFEIVRFAERMKAKNWIDRFDIAGSDVLIHFNGVGKDALRRFTDAAKKQDLPATGRALMHARILEAAEAKRKQLATQSVQAPSHSPDAVKVHPKSADLLGPILQTLMHGSRPADDVVRLVSIRMKVPMHQRNEPWLENGTTFDDAVRHAMNYLIEKRLVAHPSRIVGLTVEGREHASVIERFVPKGYEEPSAPAVAPVTEKKRAIEPRLLTEKEMLAFWESLAEKSHRDVLGIWRNAVRITTDPERAKYHDQARVMIRIIEHEWDARMKKGDLAESFKWPDASAAAPRVSENGKDWSSEFMVGEGMLKEMGYRVGRNGLSAPIRQAMLTQVFTRSLPPIFPKPYMQQWGDNGSARRLHKIADCLAAFARNAARLPGNYDEAISDWKEDLEYLHDTHYVGQFGFGWPKRPDGDAPDIRHH